MRTSDQTYLLIAGLLLMFGGSLIFWSQMTAHEKQLTMNWLKVKFPEAWNDFPETIRTDFDDGYLLN